MIPYLIIAAGAALLGLAAGLLIWAVWHRRRSEQAPSISIMTADGRRAAAFGAVLGGSIVMTIFAAVSLWLIRANAALVFWMGMAAHAQIAIALTGFIAMFVKRSIGVGKDGLTVNDLPGVDP